MVGMDEGTKMIHPDAGRMVPTAASSASGDAVGCIGVKSILGVTVSPVNFITETDTAWYAQAPIGHVWNVCKALYTHT